MCSKTIVTSVSSQCITFTQLFACSVPSAIIFIFQTFARHGNNQFCNNKKTKSNIYYTRTHTWSWFGVARRLNGQHYHTFHYVSSFTQISLFFSPKSRANWANSYFATVTQCNLPPTEGRATNFTHFIQKNSFFRLFKSRTEHGRLHFCLWTNCFTIFNNGLRRY